MFKNRKAQEEMFGFVIIIVIVMVIAVIMFGFFLKPKQEEVKNPEVSSLLNTIVNYDTKGCNENKISDLIEDCLDGKNCKDDSDSCIYLNNTFLEIFDEIKKKSGFGGRLKGYRFEVQGEQDSKKITEIEKGDKSSVFKGSFIIVPTLNHGNVIIKLKFYYASD